MTAVAADLILARKRVAGRDIYYRPGTSDEQVIVDVFEEQYHVPPTGTPRTILDLGANIGLTMLHYRMLYPDAEIFGVEMDAENVAVAYRNTEDPVLCAAVSGHAAIECYDPAGEPWAYALAAPGDRPTVALPLSMIWPDPIDLLKVDVEGAESLLLKEDLSRFGAIIVELHGDYGKPDAIVDLRAQGFECNPAMMHDRAVYAWRP